MSFTQIKQYLFVFLLSSAGSNSFAEVTSFLVQNGSIAKCESSTDVGHRAFKLNVESVIETNLILKLETLICTSSDNENFALLPLSLATPAVFKVGQNVFTYHMEATSVSVTNTDGTVELEKFLLDPNQSSQNLTINMQHISDKKVDMTIVGLEVVKKNGQVDDQGLSFGGHFRVVGLK